MNVPPPKPPAIKIVREQRKEDACKRVFLNRANLPDYQNCFIDIFEPISRPFGSRGSTPSVASGMGTNINGGTIVR